MSSPTSCPRAARARARGSSRRGRVCRLHGPKEERKSACMTGIIAGSAWAYVLTAQGPSAPERFVALCLRDFATSHRSRRMSWPLSERLWLLGADLFACIALPGCSTGRRYQVESFTLFSARQSLRGSDSARSSSRPGRHHQGASAAGVPQASECTFKASITLSNKSVCGAGAIYRFCTFSSCLGKNWLNKPSGIAC